MTSYIINPWRLDRHLIIYEVSIHYITNHHVQEIWLFTLINQFNQQFSWISKPVFPHLWHILFCSEGHWDQFQKAIDVENKLQLFLNVRGHNSCGSFGVKDFCFRDFFRFNMCRACDCNHFFCGHCIFFPFDIVESYIPLPSQMWPLKVIFVIFFF